MTRLGLSTGLMLLALMLSACSTIESLNPFSSASSKPKPAELPPIVPTAEFKLLWQSAIGGRSAYTFTPAIVGDSVYAGSADGTLARYDDGRQIWRINAGQAISGGVGSDGKLVVVGTNRGEVLAFIADNGNLAWKTSVNSEVLAAPAVGNGVVAVRSGDSRIFGFDVADGKRRWLYQRTTPPLSLRTNAGVAMTGRTIIAGFPGGKLVAINADSGALQWEATVAIPKGATELERISDVTSLPVIRGNDVCAVAYQGRVSCFDISNGSQRWSREVSSSSGLDMDAKSVYVSDEKGAILAFDRSNGSSLWKQDKLSMRVLSKPLVVAGRLVVGDADGVVHLLKCEDGSFEARFGADGAINADPQNLKNGLLIQTRTGSVIALSLR